MNVITAISIAIVSTNVLWKAVDITCNKSIDLITTVVTRPVDGFSVIDEVITDSDIVCRLKHIRLLIKILESKIHIKENKNDEGYGDLDVINTNDLFGVSLNDIKESVEKISECVEEINKSKNYQESLYFGTWRFRLPDCDQLLKQLKQRITIFNERFNNLIKYTQLIHQL